MSTSEKRISFDSSRPSAQHVPRAYPLLIDEGQRLAAVDIPFHDLTGLFVAVDAAVHFDTCCHVNQLGDQMIIDAIVATVLPGTEDLSGSGP